MIFRIDKKFISGATIERFVVVVYEQQRRFPPKSVEDMIAGLLDSCKQVGEFVENVKGNQLLNCLTQA